MDADHGLYVASIMDSAAVLNLDGPLGQQLNSGREMGIIASALAHSRGEELVDRLLFNGRYEWVSEAIVRLGKDAFNQGRIRGVLVDDAGKAVKP